MPNDLAEEMTREVIAVFAKRRDPEHFRIIFARVAGEKKITRSKNRKQYGNFLGICQGRFFRRLSTNKDDWKSWPEKARAYLKVPETPPQSKPSTPTAMPVGQRKLPF